MITLGYRDPNTGREMIVEVGAPAEDGSGYWAVEIDPQTLETIGSMFFASLTDLY